MMRTSVSEPLCSLRFLGRVRVSAAPPIPTPVFWREYAIYTLYLYFAARLLAQTLAAALASRMCPSATEYALWVHFRCSRTGASFDFE